MVKQDEQSIREKLQTAGYAKSTEEKWVFTRANAGSGHRRTNVGLLNRAVSLIYEGPRQCPLLRETDVLLLLKLWSTQLVFWGTKASTPRMYIHYFQTLINWNLIRTFEGFFFPSYFEGKLFSLKSAWFKWRKMEQRLSLQLASNLWEGHQLPKLYIARANEMEISKVIFSNKIPILRDAKRSVRINQ